MLILNDLTVYNQSIEYSDRFADPVSTQLSFDFYSCLSHFTSDFILVKFGVDLSVEVLI